MYRTKVNKKGSNPVLLLHCFLHTYTNSPWGKEFDSSSAYCSCSCSSSLSLITFHAS